MSCPPRRSPRLVGQPPPTPEQRAVIEAPLEPSLVVAGAGSGKTRDDGGASRLAPGQRLVEPDQVLGLTFTRKAAGELAERVRSGAHLAAARAWCSAAPSARPGPTGFRAPTISTYNSYAASLVPTTPADRPATRRHDSSARPRSGSWPTRWSRRGRGDLETDAASPRSSKRCSPVGALDEHLLEPQARCGIGRSSTGSPRRRRDAAAQPSRRRSRSWRRSAAGSACALLDSSRSHRSASAPRTRSTSATRSPSPPGSRRRAEGRARGATAVPGGAARRVPGHVVRPARSCWRAVRRRAPGHRGRRPEPVDLRVAWGAARAGLGRLPATSSRRSAPTARRSPADVHPLSTSWRNDRLILAAANHVATPLRASAARGARAGARAPGPAPATVPVHAHVAETVEDEARAVARSSATGGPAGPGRDR